MPVDIKSLYRTEEGKQFRTDIQDVSGVINQNTAERISGENEQRGANARKFASVPMVLLEQLKHTHGIDWALFGIDQEHTGRLLRWMQDPANLHWRTSEASLGNANRFVR